MDNLRDINRESVDFGPDPSEVDLNVLKDISDTNFETQKKVLTHAQIWVEAANEKLERYKNREISGRLSDIVLDPRIEVDEKILNTELNLASVSLEYNREELLKSRQGQISNYIKALEEDRRLKLNESIFRKKKDKYDIRSKYSNVFRLETIDDNNNTFINALRSKEVKRALILTDTFLTRDQIFYKKVVDILKRNEIDYVEYTNVQPHLDRKLIFRISEFAMSHEVNSIIVVGSQSTVDLSKILLAKMLRPSIINLHRMRTFRMDAAQKYSIFSIPTVVVPDDKVNSRSVVENHIFFPKTLFFGNVLFLKGDLDDSDGVFYCDDMFSMLSNAKIKEILDESFFRCIFNYFDLSSSRELRDSIISNIHMLKKMMRAFNLTKTLSDSDRHELLRIVATNMDGRSVVDVSEFWMWNKLECGLSHLVNSKKSDGLALFLPSFLEVMASASAEFSKAVLDLASRFDPSHPAYSVEGFIYRIIMHIKEQGLPISLVDIPQVRRIDYKFLSLLLRKSCIGWHSKKIYAVLKKLIVT